MNRFKVGDRVYWTTDSRHILGTVIETGVMHGNGVSPDRPDGIRVRIDPDSRPGAWGQQDRAETEVWAGWSQRMQLLK